MPVLDVTAILNGQTAEDNILSIQKLIIILIIKYSKKYNNKVKYKLSTYFLKSLTVYKKTGITF